MAVPKVVASTQNLLTSNYTNIKAKLLEIEHKIYFLSKTRFEKRFFRNILVVIKFFFNYSPRGTNIFFRMSCWSLFFNWSLSHWWLQNYTVSCGVFPSDRWLSMNWRLNVISWSVAEPSSLVRLKNVTLQTVNTSWWFWFGFLTFKNVTHLCFMPNIQKNITS